MHQKSETKSFEMLKKKKKTYTEKNNVGCQFCPISQGNASFLAVMLIQQLYATPGWLGLTIAESISNAFASALLPPPIHWE